jgi:hypothetical protein
VLDLPADEQTPGDAVLEDVRDEVPDDGSREDDAMPDDDGAGSH